TVPEVGGGAELIGYGLSERTGNNTYRALGAGADIIGSMGIGTPARSIPVISNINRIGKEFENFSGLNSGINIAKEGILGYSDFSTIESNLTLLTNSHLKETQY